MKILNKICNFFKFRKPNVDDILRSYEENGWYEHPGNKELLEKIFANYKPGSFIPYAWYNEDMDAIEVYFKNDNAYTKPLNKNLDLYLSQETDEIIGVHILNASKVVNSK